MASFPPRYILLLDKEADVTAFSYVPKLRKIFRTKKIGHAGTLDPFATGLMTYAIGRATASLQFIESLSKVYRVEAVFGKATDSFDRDGEVVASLDRAALKEKFAAVDLEAAVRTVAARGEQTVPIYSALKKDGKPYYQYAREGKTVDLPTRRVETELLAIDAPVLTERGPSLTFTLKVSKGTYIRSFVEDLGRLTGLYAYCQNLRRLTVGGLEISGACDFPTLERAVEEIGEDPDTAEIARGDSTADCCMFGGSSGPSADRPEPKTRARLPAVQKLKLPVDPGVHAMTFDNRIWALPNKEAGETLKACGSFTPRVRWSHSQCCLPIIRSRSPRSRRPSPSVFSTACIWGTRNFCENSPKWRRRAVSIPRSSPSRTIRNEARNPAFPASS